MPVQTDHLADEIKDLTASVNGLKTEFAGFRGSVDSQLGTIKWAGRFVATFLGGLFLAALGLAWNASALNSEVKQQGTRLDKVESQLGRLDKIESQLGQLIQRIDQGGQLKAK